MTEMIRLAESQVITGFAQHLDTLVAAGDLSDDTRRTYLRGLDRYIKDGIADVQEWKAALRVDMSANTINTWLSGVRAFARWAVGAGYIQSDPTAGVKGIKLKGRGHKRGILTDAEMSRLLKVYNSDDREARRNRAILYLFAYTGARIIELRRANYTDLYTEHQRLILRVQGKGRDEEDPETLVLPRTAIEPVYDYLCLHEKFTPLFYSVSRRNYGDHLSLRSFQRIVMNAFDAAGVIKLGKPKTTHSLRHTAITNAIRNGAALPKVQGMARHTSIATTMIYFHELDRVENPAEDFITYE